MSAPVVISSVSSCDLASQVSTVSRIVQSIELRYRPNSYFRLGRVSRFSRIFLLELILGEKYTSYNERIIAFYCLLHLF